MIYIYIEKIKLNLSINKKSAEILFLITQNKNKKLIITLIEKTPGDLLFGKHPQG